MTSSSPTAGGACAGAGIGPTMIDSVLGVAKAYISRVGGGPFPTELDNPTGEAMVEIGGEFGTVTGRRRRCGWLDGVVLRYAVRVNGITELALTKLDVLSHFDTLRVATAYDSLDVRYTEFPRQQRVLYNCHPVYQDLAGWGQDISRGGAVRRPPQGGAAVRRVRRGDRRSAGDDGVGGPGSVRHLAPDVTR